MTTKILTLADLPPMSQEEKDWWNEHDLEYYHYLYRIDNIINGMFYYGIHSQRKDLGKEPENDGYMGSGTDLKKAQKEEGLDNFKKTVVKIFSTRDEARLEEMRIVTQELVDDKMCYNLTLGGGGCRGGFWITDGKTNKKIYTDEEVPDGWTKGRVISEENRSAMVKGSKVMYINRFTLESRWLTKEEIEEEEKDTWFTSSFFANDGKFIEYSDFQEIFEKTNSWNSVAEKFNICIESVRKIRDYYIGLGYVFTSDYKRSRPKDLGRWSSRMKDKVYINNGKEYKVINSSDLDKYLNEGWTTGRAFTKDEDITKIEEEFLITPSIRSVARRLHRSDKSVVEALKYRGNEKIIWATKGEQVTRTKVPNGLLERFLSAGWKIK